MQPLTLDSQRDYRRALGSYPTGVAIVTARTKQGVSAITVNSFVSVSLEPPLLLWSIAKTSERYAVFSAAERWGISVLSAAQQGLAARYAARGAPLVCDGDICDGACWAPLIDQALAHFDCRTASRIPAGDHLLILGQVDWFAAYDGDALTYRRGAFGSHC